MNPSEQITTYIESFDDWRGTLLLELRNIILAASPDITEEWKWSVPVFVQNGMFCAISAFKDHVKINFFKGAQLIDKHKILNAGFTSKSHRSIDFREGDVIPKADLQDLIQEAVAVNTKNKS